MLLAYTVQAYYLLALSVAALSSVHVFVVANAA